MKYLSLIALIATASAIKIEGAFDCEYHLSEDGESCIKVNSPCNDMTPVPILEKCPARQNASSRSATPPPAPKVELPAADSNPAVPAADSATAATVASIA